CVGAVTNLAASPGAPIPLLLTARQENLGVIAATPEQKKKLTVVVAYALDPGKEALANVEEHTKAIVEWAKANGPFEAIGASVDGATPEVQAYAIKRLAVTIQGLNLAGDGQALDGVRL